MTLVRFRCLVPGVWTSQVDSRTQERCPGANESRPSKIWTIVSNRSLKRDPNEMCIVLTIDGSLSWHHMIQYYSSGITEYDRYHFTHRPRKSSLQAYTRNCVACFQAQRSETVSSNASILFKLLSFSAYQLKG